MQSMKSIMDKEKGPSGSKFPKPPPTFVGVPTVRIRKKSAGSRSGKNTNNDRENKNLKTQQGGKTGKLQSSIVSDLYSNLTNTSKILPEGSSNNLNTGKHGKPKMVKAKKKRPPSESSSSSNSSRSSVSSGSSGSGSSGSGSSGSGSSGSGSYGISGSSVSSGEFKLRRGLQKKKRQDELMQEKVEMLTRIVNLSKNGFSPTKKWTMKDDIDEIRYECYRLQRESNTKKSIKMMRQVLVSITTMIEMGNAYFNPFNLRLEGFSKNMMLSLSDYDDCFDQLHHKYSGRSSVGPEMQIMFTFLSAAVFHHAGNAINQKEDPKSKVSSSPMSSMMGMMGMLGGLGGGSGMSSTKSSSSPKPPFSMGSTTDNTPPVVEPVSEEETPEKPKRRKMKGPGMASIPTSIIGSLAPPASSVTATMPSMKIPAA